MDDDANPLSLLIGRRVAARRTLLGLSLDDLAAETGVSRSMISRIERGEVHASAVVLDRLCAGIGLSLSALFAREQALPLLRRADQPVWCDPASGYRRREVAPDATGSRIRIAEIEFPAGAQVTFPRSRSRIIEQHVWMLEGRLEIGMAGEMHSLGAGDCLYMRHNEDVVFRNPGGNPARYALVVNKEPTP